MTGSIEATLRRELDAARDRIEELAARRQNLQRELAAASAAEAAERRGLEMLEAIARGSHADAPTSRHNSSSSLSGSALRTMIARVALRGDRDSQPAHWRSWHGWLNAAGYTAAGKRPEATFLTQLARSPMVARTGQDGIYVLDVTRFSAAQRELRELHDLLTQLPPPDQLSMLVDARTRRRELQMAISRQERALDEMWQVMASEIPNGWRRDAEPTPERLVAWWVRRREHLAQERLRA